MLIVIIYGGLCLWDNCPREGQGKGEIAQRGQGTSRKVDGARRNVQDKRSISKPSVTRGTATEARGRKYLGAFEVTAYSWTGHRTASGQWPKVGMVAARDLPLGTRLHIEGIGVVTVADRMPKDSRAELDIYMGKGKSSVREAKEWGRKKVRVWRVE